MPVKTPYVHGSALITALFIMALIVIAVTAMSVRLQSDIKHTQLVLTQDRLYLAAQSVTFWGMDTLIKEQPPFKIQFKNHALFKLPPSLRHLNPTIYLKGYIFDEQAKFNINNLQEKKYHLLFLNLLQLQRDTATKQEQQAILNALYYWLTSSLLKEGYHADFKVYLKQHPPYLPAFQPMQHASELRLIKGITPKRYNDLARFITALPEVTPININTAPKSILMALSHFDQISVNELITQRTQHVLKEKHLHALLQKWRIPLEQMSVESNYYLTVATAMSSESTLTLYTLLYRNQNKGSHPSVSIIYQSINTN